MSNSAIQILIQVCTHFTLTARQIQRLIFPDADKDGRQTRRLLTDLVHKQWINKTRCEVVSPLHGVTCPVYFPSRLGIEALAMHTGDPQWLHTPTQTPNWQHLAHWVALSDLRITINAAVAGQRVVKLTAFYNEFDTVEDSTDPSRRFRTYTVVETVPKRVVAVPDAFFELEAAGHRKAFAVELERGTNPVAKACNEKAPGMAGMAKKNLHQRIFPLAMDAFWCLMFAPNAAWRDQLRRAFSFKDGSHVWRFASLQDVKPETFLFSPIFYPCAGDPVPLIKGSGK